MRQINEKNDRLTKVYTVRLFFIDDPIHWEKNIIES